MKSDFIIPVITSIKPLTISVIFQSSPSFNYNPIKL